MSHQYQFASDPTALYYGSNASGLVEIVADSAHINNALTCDTLTANEINCDNLNVSGDAIITNLIELTVEAPIIEFATGNTMSDELYTGTLAHYKPAVGAAKVAGLIREPGSGDFLLIKDAADVSTLAGAVGATLGLDHLSSITIDNANQCSSGTFVTGAGGSVTTTTVTCTNVNASGTVSAGVIDTGSIVYDTSVIGPNSTLDDGTGHLTNESITTGTLTVTGSIGGDGIETSSIVAEVIEASDHIDAGDLNVFGTLNVYPSIPFGGSIEDEVPTLQVDGYGISAPTVLAISITASANPLELVPLLGDLTSSIAPYSNIDALNIETWGIAGVGGSIRSGGPTETDVALWTAFPLSFFDRSNYPYVLLSPNGDIRADGGHYKIPIPAVELAELPLIPGEGGRIYATNEIKGRHLVAEGYTLPAMDPEGEPEVNPGQCTSDIVNTKLITPGDGVGVRIEYPGDDNIREYGLGIGNDVSNAALSIRHPGNASSIDPLIISGAYDGPFDDTELLLFTVKKSGMVRTANSTFDDGKGNMRIGGTITADILNLGNFKPNANQDRVANPSFQVDYNNDPPLTNTQNGSNVVPVATGETMEVMSFNIPSNYTYGNVHWMTTDLNLTLSSSDATTLTIVWQNQNNDYSFFRTYDRSSSSVVINETSITDEEADLVLQSRNWTEDSTVGDPAAIGVSMDALFFVVPRNYVTGQSISVTTTIDAVLDVGVSTDPSEIDVTWTNGLNGYTVVQNYKQTNGTVSIIDSQFTAEEIDGLMANGDGTIGITIVNSRYTILSSATSMSLNYGTWDPFKLFVTSSGSGIVSASATIAVNYEVWESIAKLSSGLYTLNNTIDDGFGNMEITGTLVVGEQNITGTIVGAGDYAGTATDGQYLTWNNGTSKWGPTTLPDTSEPDIGYSELNDVNLTSIATNDIMQWNGTEWINTDELTTGTIYCTGTDFRLSNTSRGASGNGVNRALVNETGNKLVINYGGDYTGGVVINGDVLFTGAMVGNTSTSTLDLGNWNGSSYIASGSATDPRLKFDNDTGIWSEGDGKINFTSNGTNRVTLDNSNLYLNGCDLNLGTASGSETGPRIFFDGDTGIFSDADGELSISANSNKMFTVGDGDITVYGNLWGQTLLLEGDLKIKGDRAMVSETSSEVLRINYNGDFTNGTQVDGKLTATGDIVTQLAFRNNVYANNTDTSGTLQWGLNVILLSTGSLLPGDNWVLPSVSGKAGGSVYVCNRAINIIDLGPGGAIWIEAPGGIKIRGQGENEDFYQLNAWWTIHLMTDGTSWFIININ